MASSFPEFFIVGNTSAINIIEMFFFFVFDLDLTKKVNTKIDMLLIFVPFLIRPFPIEIIFKPRFKQ